MSKQLVVFVIWCVCLAGTTVGSAFAGWTPWATSRGTGGGSGGGHAYYYGGPLHK
jgi:hypothetical protein